ncbi:MAG TPA: glycine cleavage system protein H [Blastocatellia bacterium]|nr:glycine cleavage system protein H [Blastocatellia bacterium]HMX24450.1 glycine cleavage system protein H [Blastocatellia bacterium]HMY76043.1 glycine cleavage system protein H [Blastocatellia bacterium]HMZ21887.1 glycine cleavage system protein H [Blastocatellia bacterium]
MVTEVKSDRRYTKTHEWAMQSAGTVLIGVSAFHVEELGEIMRVTIDVKAGDTITAGKVFGTIEGTGTLDDIFTPVSGKIARVNTDPMAHPEIVNNDCWGKGWMIEIMPSDTNELSALLTPQDYTQFIQTA